jgi:uncharacterized membrane protein YjfL (UPF0719 family)
MTDHLLLGVVQSILYSLIGVAVFALSFWVIAKLLPFSVRKEIEEDQNTALGIVLGAIILGLSLIIASAIH